MVDGLVKKEANQGLVDVLQTVSEGLEKKDPAILAPGIVMLKEWKNKIDRVIDMTTQALRKKVVADGTQVTEKGSKELIAGEWILAVRPQNSEDTLDDTKVQAKLLAKGIATEQGMDATIVYSANREKLKMLIEESRLTEQDLKDCYAERKYALQAPKPVEKKAELPAETPTVDLSTAVEAEVK